MKTYETLIADIRTEACELADKLKRLEVFMMSEDFCKISPEQKGLLEQQYDLMAKYKVILVKRAHRINYEHEHEEACTCEPEKEPAKAPALTFDTNPEICEKCTHHTKAWSTCHDCVDGSNCSSKETAVESHHCYNCKYGAPKHAGPGIVSYSCSCLNPCHNGDRWEKL